MVFQSFNIWFTSFDIYRPDSYTKLSLNLNIFVSRTISRKTQHEKTKKHFKKGIWNPHLKEGVCWGFSLYFWYLGCYFLWFKAKDIPSFVSDWCFWNPLFQSFILATVSLRFPTQKTLLALIGQPPGELSECISDLSLQRFHNPVRCVISLWWYHQFSKSHEDPFSFETNCFNQFTDKFRNFKNIWLCRGL